MAMGDEIRLSTYGETIEVRQGLSGRVVLQVQTDDGHAAPVLTPPECDALIAAIGRALGRPAGGDAARIVNAIVADLSDRRGLKGEWRRIDDDIRTEIVAEWTRIVGDGMGGCEQGATVPRAGVAAVVARFEANAITADKGEQFGKDTRNAHLEACSKAEAKVWRRAAAETAATIVAAGLWTPPGGEREA